MSHRINGFLFEENSLEKRRERIKKYAEKE
jgi:hypothetical protein